jgi:hypothetical protein
MRVVERSFSEFLRQPNDVVAELAEHDVLLRRRSAPALLLSRADRGDDRSESFVVLARLLRNLALHSPKALDEAVDDAFDWVTFLPKTDRHLFAEELTRTLLGASVLDNYSPVAQLLREWKATAEIHADPKLARRIG